MFECTLFHPLAITPYLKMVKLPVIGIFQLIEEWNLPVRLAGRMMATMLQGQTASRKAILLCDSALSRKRSKWHDHHELNCMF